MSRPPPANASVLSGHQVRERQSSETQTTQLQCPVTSSGCCDYLNGRFHAMIVYQPIGPLQAGQF
jgi:hypothetical protein